MVDERCPEACRLQEEPGRGYGGLCEGGDGTLPKAACERIDPLGSLCLGVRPLSNVTFIKNTAVRDTLQNAN